MNTYIQEEFVLQGLTIVAFILFLIPFLIAELSKKKYRMDEFTKYRFKKVMIVAYQNFLSVDKSTAKEKTIDFIKDIDRKNLLNEKYDSIRRLKDGIYDYS